MKKLNSWIFAIASTLFLMVGAMRAAEKFDTLGSSSGNRIDSNVLHEGPSLPCNVAT